MKHFIFILSVVALSISCGSTKTEEERQQKIEDSIANIESISAIEKANSLLNSDSTNTDSKKTSNK